MNLQSLVLDLVSGKELKQLKKNLTKGYKKIKKQFKNLIK